MATSFKLKLLRQDTDVGSIPVLNENSFLSPPTINKRPLADCTNEVKVQYVERVGVTVPDVIPILVVCDNQGLTLFCVMSNGTVYSAGGHYNVDGLGDGTEDYGVDISDTRTVAYSGSLSLVSLFESQPLALTDGGQLIWWGNFGYYNYACNSLGYDRYRDGSHVWHDALLPFSSLTPTEGITDISFESISMGYWVAGGIDGSGRLWTWGYEGLGTLGRGLGDGTLRIPTPAEVVHPEGRTWVYFHTGNVGACAIDDLGQLWCWGDNSYGMCGIGVSDATDDYFDTPQKVGTDTDWVKAFSSETRTVALKSNGEIWGWGFNSDEYWLNHDCTDLGCGADDRDSSPPITWCEHWTPYKMSGSHVFTDLSVGFYHIMALKSNGTVWGMGMDDYYGPLGLGDNTYFVTDWTQVTEGDQTLFTSIHCAYGVSMGIGIDDNVYIWGTFYGIDYADRYYPTRWQLPNQTE